MNLTVIASLVSGTIASLAGFALAWNIQAKTIVDNSLEQANERINIQRAARQNLEGSLSRLSLSQTSATLRANSLRVDVSNLTNVGNGLRLTTDNSIRAITSNPTVCPDTAIALGELFNDSSKAYGELAEAAQRHTIDIQALMDRQPQ